MKKEGEKISYGTLVETSEKKTAKNINRKVTQPV